MTMLVTLDQAIRHLRLDDVAADSPDADEVTLKATHASAVVLDFVNVDGKDDWDSDSVPGAVQAAVLLVLSDLWEHRAGSSDEDVFLSIAAVSLLRPYRDPPLA